MIEHIVTWAQIYWTYTFELAYNWTLNKYLLNKTQLNIDVIKW